MGDVAPALAGQITVDRVAVTIQHFQPLTAKIAVHSAVTGRDVGQILVIHIGDQSDSVRTQGIDNIIDRPGPHAGIEHGLGLTLQREVTETVPPERKMRRIHAGIAEIPDQFLRVKGDAPETFLEHLLINRRFRMDRVSVQIVGKCLVFIVESKSAAGYVPGRAHLQRRESRRQFKHFDFRDCGRHVGRQRAAFKEIFFHSGIEDVPGGDQPPGIGKFASGGDTALQTVAVAGDSAGIHVPAHGAGLVIRPGDVERNGFAQDGARKGDFDAHAVVFAGPHLQIFPVIGAGQRPLFPNAFGCRIGEFPAEDGFPDREGRIAFLLDALRRERGQRPGAAVAAIDGAAQKVFSGGESHGFKFNFL